MVLKNNYNNEHYNAETETKFTIVYWMHLAVKEYKSLLTIRTHGNDCDYRYPHTNKMHRQFIQKITRQQLILLPTPDMYVYYS